MVRHSSLSEDEGMLYSCSLIAPLDWLILLATRIGKGRKSRDRADLANVSEFTRRYLTCQISAILYADRGDRRKSQSPHRAHLAIYADRGDRRTENRQVCQRLMRPDD